MQHLVHARCGMGTQTLKAGILIGHRYQLESLLGQGGLGRVYLARDLLEGETRVALKILATPQRINGQWVSLRQELSLLARLRHPNLARIRDFGILEGNRAPFVAEDFVAGDDLLTATAGWNTAQIVELLVSVSRVRSVPSTRTAWCIRISSPAILFFLPAFPTLKRSRSWTLGWLGVCRARGRALCRVPCRTLLRNFSWVILLPPDLICILWEFFSISCLLIVSPLRMKIRAF